MWRTEGEGVMSNKTWKLPIYIHTQSEANLNYPSHNYFVLMFECFRSSNILESDQTHLVFTSLTETFQHSRQTVLNLDLLFHFFRLREDGIWQRYV